MGTMNIIESWNSHLFYQLYSESDEDDRINLLREIVYWAPRLANAKALSEHLSISLDELENMVLELQRLGFQQFSEFHADTKLVEEWDYPLYGYHKYYGTAYVVSMLCWDRRDEDLYAKDRGAKE